jgi:hypothetical protein
MIGCKNKISRKKNKYSVKKVLQQRLHPRGTKLSNRNSDSVSGSEHDKYFMEAEQNGKV